MKIFKFFLWALLAVIASWGVFLVAETVVKDAKTAAFISLGVVVAFLLAVALLKLTFCVLAAITAAMAIFFAFSAASPLFLIAAVFLLLILLVVIFKLKVFKSAIIIILLLEFALIFAPALLKIFNVF